MALAVSDRVTNESTVEAWPQVALQRVHGRIVASAQPGLVISLLGKPVLVVK